MKETTLLKNKKVLIHLHVFYIEQLDHFLKAIKKISYHADITLTISTSESLYDYVSREIRKRIDDALIFKVADRGYDVGPFVYVLHEIDLNEYDYVIKLHTKSRGDEGKTLLNGVLISNSIWEDIMVDALIGSEERFCETLLSFENEEIGLAAAEMCLISDDESRASYYFYRVNDELRKMGLPELKNKDDFIFAAGTMFAVRARLLKPLLTYDINDFGLSYSHIHDCTLAHVFERLFSGIVLSQGYTLKGLRSKPFKGELKKVERKKIRAEKKRNGDSLIDNAGLYIRKINSKLMYRFAKLKVIEKSEYFNEKWYRWRYLKNEDPNLSPESHYLKCGFQKGYEPSPLFNGNQYMAYYSDLRNKQINPLLHFECYGRYEHRMIFENDSKWNADIESLRQSKLFDAKWYLDNNPDVKQAKMDPILHYYLHGGSEGRDPSVNFCSNEYLEINPDVKAAKVNPLCHFEQYGRSQGRKVSYSQIIDEENNKTIYEKFEKEYSLNPFDKKRTAIVAADIKDGIIADSLLILLNGIKEVCDNVVLIGNNGLIAGEEKKFSGIAAYACFDRHHMGRFGSYKKGYLFCRKNGLLESDRTEELILVDDSKYGPIYPFEESFAYMKGLKWDCWSYSNNIMHDTFNIDSSFCVFHRKPIDSKLLDEFFCRVRDDEDLIDVDPILESQLSSILSEQGMAVETMIPKKDQKKININDRLIALKGYRVPLVEKTVLNAGSGQEKEILSIIKENNPLILEKLDEVADQNEVEGFDLEVYRKKLRSKTVEIKERILKGDKIRVTFLVFDFHMFAAKPLFDRMLEDPLFDAHVAVIPDIRFSGSGKAEQDRCERLLLKLYDRNQIRKIRPDYYGLWPEIFDDVDIVCYPSPYNVSIYRYNVRYALQKSFLPIIVNYGFSSTQYDYELLSFYNYAYYWKVFLENRKTFDEYQNRSVVKSDNGELIGYVKMDAMKEVMIRQRTRKRILVALHHSIDEGFNDSLSLANFLRYHQYFKKLPDRYPDIDFVFRPHPFLRKALEQNKKWGKEKLNEYINELCKKDNAEWVEDNDYFEDFANSDACIQDCGSFLVEYLYTKKPCCYMLKRPEDVDEKFSDLGKDCLKRYYLSYNMKDIDRFIDEIVEKGNDYMKAEREDFAEYIMVNYPYASKIAVESIKRSIIGED